MTTTIAHRLGIGIFSVAVLFGVAGNLACQRDLARAARSDANPTPEVRRVKTTPVTRTQVEHIVTALGTLAPLEQATLRVKVPGRLQSIPVDLGTTVRPGQLVAQIEPDDYRLRVQQAAAALAQARARLGLPAEGSSDRVDPEQTGLVRQARAVLEQEIGRASCRERV